MRDQVQIYKDQSYLNSTVCNSKILATQPYLLCVQLSQHSSFEFLDLAKVPFKRLPRLTDVASVLEES